MNSSQGTVRFVAGLEVNLQEAFSPTFEKDLLGLKSFKKF